MGWRKVSGLNVGDTVQLEDRVGVIESKTRYPEQARGAADLEGYTVRVRYGDTSRAYIILLGDKVYVPAARRAS